jgi:hypothetical protein
MTLHRALLVVGSIALVAGLLAVFVLDGEAGWFAYAPLSEGESFAITGGTVVTDRQMVGLGLLASAAIIAAGLIGHRVGARRGTST